MPWPVSSVAEPQPTDGSVVSGSSQGHGPRSQAQSSCLPRKCAEGTKSLSLSHIHFTVSPPPTCSKKNFFLNILMWGLTMKLMILQMHKCMPIYTSKANTLSLNVPTGHPFWPRFHGCLSMLKGYGPLPVLRSHFWQIQLIINPNWIEFT